ncbi:hypothetical protein HDU99_003451 [Rhizoclosmatium hyalinum]|nr:hypothetical protein HDU99_003451 [Rhizoclosmatium hyalinum]
MGSTWIAVSLSLFNMYNQKVLCSESNPNLKPKFRGNLEEGDNQTDEAGKDQYMTLMENYTKKTTGHEVTCGKFANTMDAHKWDEIKSHDNFIKTPTLWKAVEVAQKLFGGMDKSGLQFMNWDCGIRSTAIHGNSKLRRRAKKAFEKVKQPCEAKKDLEKEKDSKKQKLECAL